MTKVVRYALVCGGVLAVASLSACQRSVVTTGHQLRPAKKVTVQASGSRPSVHANPDFGGTVSKYVEATATGSTLESAVDNAIELAVEQVNGKRVAATTLQIRLGASVEANGQSASVTSRAFADAVASATSGAVTNFRVLSQKQVTNPSSVTEESLQGSQGASWNRGDVDASADASASAGDARASASEGVKGQWDQQQGAVQVNYQRKHTDYVTQWEVRIGADVAAYREAADAKLTRVVVATPHVESSTYQVGDNIMASDVIASAIRAQVTEALTQTHRFTVLDRGDNAESNQEIDLIRSGNATPADTARLGQRLAADLIVIPTINSFEYVRHERALQLAQRTLVFYSGAGKVSFQIVNAVTGQIVMSKSFDYAFPSTSPTTLGVSVDGNKLATEMMSEIDREFVAAILRSTYPLAVLRVQGGNVIINQGGDVVQQGAVYRAVLLGKAIVDPQTGRSLGPIETPCCTIAIDRVTPDLSYGHIVGSSVQIASVFTPGDIELRDEIPSRVADQTPIHTQARQRAAAAPRQKPKPAASDDDANW